MKRISLFFLFLILLLSFLLGARMVLSGDFFYLYDQARDYLLVQNIVDTRDLVLIGSHSGLSGFFHGPLWLYILTPVYILGSGNPFSFTYAYVGLQLTTVLLAYLIGSKLYGNKGGLLISLLIALSPATWSTVQNTIGVNVVSLVFLGLFYFLIKFLRGNKNSFIFAAFFAGLSLQFETALPLILIPVMVIIFLWNKIAIKNLRVILLSFISYFLSLGTFILFDLRHKFLMTNALIGVVKGGIKEKGYLEFEDRIIAHVNSLLAVYESILFILCQYFIFFVCIHRNNDIKYRKEFGFLLLFPALTYGFFMLYSYPVWPEYVFGLLIPVAFAFYLALITVWKNSFGKILVIIFFVITSVNVLGFLQNQYLMKYQPVESAGSYINQLAVVDWIFIDAEKGKFGYFVYTPETFTHGMDYLISWKAKSYPDKIPTKNKELITYLILYPHIENDEGAYDFWKKNTLRTNSQILLTKTFIGGITVEKLLINKSEPEVDPNYYQGLLFR